MSSDEASVRLAVRLVVPFAAALAIAEGIDLKTTYIAPLVAAGLAVQPVIRLSTALVMPLAVWLIVHAVAIGHEAFATTAPMVYAALTFAGLYAGFRMCAAGGPLATLGYVTLIICTETPMRFMSTPELVGVVADDVGRNALVGTLCAWAAGLVLRGPAPGALPSLAVPLPPATAAAVTTLAAYLVWVLEPPAPGSLLISVLITLRAGAIAGPTAARDRVIAALIGGLAALLATGFISLAYVLPTYFLALLACGYPLALVAVRPGRWQNMGAKSLNVLALLTAEGFSPLYTDTEDRLWTRLAGVLIGVAYAGLWLALLGRHDQAPDQARRLASPPTANSRAR